MGLNIDKSCVSSGWSAVFSAHFPSVLRARENGWLSFT